jgi:uncharacterized protein YjbI with pentapeptide repeats
MRDHPVQEPSGRPVPEGFSAWPDYWKAQGLSWRTEPEIGHVRQAYLTERRAVKPDIQQGIYPFKDITLTRADVEWLLETHESGGIDGPVDWHEPSQREREGVDLRGADLREADLHSLPLARMRGGLLADDWPHTSRKLRESAAARLDGADLSRAHLEGSSLRVAHLVGASLFQAHLEGATLVAAHLEGANLFEAHLAGAELRRVYFDTATYLRAVDFGGERQGGPSLADVHWDGVNLARVTWTQAHKRAGRRRRQSVVLGDEWRARQAAGSDGKSKDAQTRLAEFEEAVRANRQLATVLREQGLNEDADRFAFRAQVLQRQVLRRQGQLGRAFGSWLLDLVSGYGYKPMRSVIAYVLIICLFAGAYLLNAQFAAPHLSWDEALVLSISSFHGRGFFSSGISLGDTLARLAAGEAIIGLLIEITFIATFTQRFFAR